MSTERGNVRDALGLSGRVAAYFQTAQITPLLAIAALLLGIFAVLVTPREEEPQINVTMANVLIPFPGASARDVEQMVAAPAEQVLSQITGIEHVMSVSRPGLAIVTVQYKVGVRRTEALVRLYDTVNSNADWLPKGLGVLDPLIKPKGIDDVPIVTLTLFSRNPAVSAFELERVAHSIESDLKRVAGTREVNTIGGPGRAVVVEIDPVRMASSGVTVPDLRTTLRSANLGLPVGELLVANRAVAVESGPFLKDARDVAELVVGVRDARPIFLQNVATVRDGPLPASRYVWQGVTGKDGGEYPAVTIAVTKKPGENAIDVANAVMRRVEMLRNTVVPHDIEVSESRNYGVTANDKAQMLIQKLLFATASVVALVFLAACAQVVLAYDKHHRNEQSHAIAARVRPGLQKIGERFNANVKVVEVPPGPPVQAPIVAEIYGPDAQGRRDVAKAVRARFDRTEGIVDVDDSSIAAAPKTLLLVDRRKAAMLGVPQEVIVSTLRAGLTGEATSYLHDETKYPAAATLQLPAEQQGDLDTLLQLGVRSSSGKLVPIRELVTVTDSLREQPIYHKDLLPVNFVVGNMAGRVDSPLYGMFAMSGDVRAIVTPGGGMLAEYFIRPPDDPYRDYSIKWDGEWQLTYEMFRDMGGAYAVGLVLIYLLVVAQFGSYRTPLIIMAPIPLTVIGVMPGHALLGAQYTATSLIGMIALAGIIVRNSILLVDFINIQLSEGVGFKEAVVRSAITRAQPIMLTGLAAMLGAFFILDDPIFNGLAISLIFGIFVSTLLTLVVIPVLYYSAYRTRLMPASQGVPA